MHELLNEEKQKKAMTPQQEKMKLCNADAGAKKLKGGERKKFMSECLKGRVGEESARHEAGVLPTAAEASPHNRMKACNDEAGRQNLHGDERRAFMSTCLKG